MRETAREELKKSKMTNKETITNLVDIYLQQFPGEKDSTKLFSDYLARNDADRLFTRKNFDGHITTSAFIIDPAHTEILLLRHKSLNRWLQPGGHVEADATLLLSALREAEEETGIPKIEMKNVSVFPNNEVPFDIDSHYIPANPKKQEDGHYHHDLRYLFEYTGDGNIVFNTDESTGLKWVKLADLVDDATFGLVVKKIGEIKK
jgi:8-oxo-dGTP pyrophosphatase MutT (NUDIX family)